MKKIVRQQNYLKELIVSQNNPVLSRQALKCWIRSALEPLLDNPEAGVVFYRIENKEGLIGLLKRLEHSEIESINFSDNSGNLIEKVWANTEFLFVMTHRYVSIIIWDNNAVEKGAVRYYSLYNSKLQREPLDIVKRNSKVDIANYIEKYNPDRRDNLLLNNSIRKLLINMDEASQDAVLGYAEQSAGVLVDSDYAQKKSRVIAHEIRNQLSICDLYSNIIKKHLESKNLEAIKVSLQAIDKSLKMASNSLLALKTKEKSFLSICKLKEIIESSIQLSGVYLENKGISLEVENESDLKLLTDSEKLIAVIINLVKNASEAFLLEEDDLKNGKYIKIKTEKEENEMNIYISNNAQGIEEPEKIFNEGFTTKKGGSGLGLWICKKTIEELGGNLSLSRYDKDFTEFRIKLNLGD